MRLSFIVAFTMALAPPVVAQERPFIFSVATAPDSKPAVRVDYDLGVGERAFQSDSSNQPEQRVGVQASRGRLTLLGRVGSPKSAVRTRVPNRVKRCTRSCGPNVGSRSRRAAACCTRPAA